MVKITPKSPQVNEMKVWRDCGIEAKRRKECFRFFNRFKLNCESKLLITFTAIVLNGENVCLGVKLH